MAHRAVAVSRLSDVLGGAKVHHHRDISDGLFNHRDVKYEAMCGAKRPPLANPLDYPCCKYCNYLLKLEGSKCPSLG